MGRPVKKPPFDRRMCAASAAVDNERHNTDTLSFCGFFASSMLETGQGLLRSEGMRMASCRLDTGHGFMYAERTQWRGTIDTTAGPFGTGM